MANPQGDSHNKVLLVDDEETMIITIRELLHREGLQVQACSSGEEGLNILKEQQDIFLIVSDYKMPGMTGIDFFQRAKMMMPNALKILYTGFSDMETVIEAINRGGVYKYIIKPFKSEEFSAVIKEAVRQYGLSQISNKLAEMVKKQNQELKNTNSELAQLLQKQAEELKHRNDDIRKAVHNININIIKTFCIMADFIDNRNKKYPHHSKNVAEIAIRIARDLQLTPEIIEKIRIASLLHDIGKIDLSEAIIQKESLDLMLPKELQEYKDHTMKGFLFLGSFESFADIAHMIKHHHEAINGRGFPDELMRDEIPLGSRIIGMADFLDKTLRKFKPNEAIQFTTNEIRNNSTKKFDPSLCKLAEAKLNEYLACLTTEL